MNGLSEAMNHSVTARAPVKREGFSGIWFCPVCKAIVGTYAPVTKNTFIFAIEKCNVCGCELNWDKI